MRSFEIPISYLDNLDPQIVFVIDKKNFFFDLKEIDLDRMEVWDQITAIENKLA